MTDSTLPAGVEYPAGLTMSRNVARIAACASYLHEWTYVTVSLNWSATMRGKFEWIVGLATASLLTFAFPGRPWWVFGVAVLVVGVTFSVVDKQKLNRTNMVALGFIAALTALAAKLLF